MVPLPKFPNLPDPENVFSIIDKTGDAIDKGLGIIDKVIDKFDRATDKFGPPEGSSQSTATAHETLKEAPLVKSEMSTTLDEISTGTACLPCSRDHLSTSSSALSEGIRFAREKGVRNPEVMRRIRIALDELNAMERIDLAPDETAKLKGAEKELADWTLRQSRDLRHDITAIKDVETMEKAAARASTITEEFMGKLWAIPEKECETCGEIREKISEFIKKRKSERGNSHGN